MKKEMKKEDIVNKINITSTEEIVDYKEGLRILAKMIARRIIKEKAINKEFNSKTDSRS